MEVFATFGVILLVGMAFPIALLFAALLFDLGALVYAMLTVILSHKRKARTVSAPTGRQRVGHRRIVLAH